MDLTEPAHSPPEPPSDQHLYDGTDITHLDEFVLDLATLSSECDYRYLSENTITSREEESTIATHDYLDQAEIERTSSIDKSDVNLSDTFSLITTSGYESDSEEEVPVVADKRRKILRKNKYKQAELSSHNFRLKGAKRKLCADDNLHHSGKRFKLSRSEEYNKLSSSDTSSDSNSDNSPSSSDSSSDSSSESSSDSSSDSNSFSCSSSDSTSSSDSDTTSEARGENSFTSYEYHPESRRKRLCPESCVCNAGQSSAPVPIERRANAPVPLYKKLLRCRLLCMANTTLLTCCKRRCYLDWT